MYQNGVIPSFFGGRRASKYARAETIGQKMEEKTMRNAKLWSVLLAAVLLCACVIGVLFTGASASDSRIPEATVVYEGSLYGESIRENLEFAAEQTWKADDVLEIQFSGTDTSAYSAFCFLLQKSRGACNRNGVPLLQR